MDGFIYNGRAWTHVWCPQCQAITVVNTDTMHADRLNDHDVMDILCSACSFVIATLHDFERIVERAGGTDVDLTRAPDAMGGAG